ncbi:MAG: type II secretion system protein GspF [Deltaproteobacteria bacterium]|nr:type II secretion system protein GspF [Deltaproteobacteria bacterium]
MPIFEYEALNNAGKALRGIIDAESARTARTKLRGQGFFPTQIREEATAASEQATPLFSFLFRQVKAKDLALALRQLATLMEAGIPLTSSLSALIEQSNHPALKKTFTQIRERVREGSSFADSLSRHPRVFSTLFIGMVRAGEASGTLDLTLSRWADFSEHQVALRQRIRTAMTYPIFMFIIGLGVLFFLMAFVVPTVTKIFSDVGQSLPLPTMILITVSGLLNRFWWAFLGGLVILGFWLRSSLRSESGALIWDRLKMKFPLAGVLYGKLAISRWSRTMGTLLNGGLPMLQALEISQGVVGNRVLTKALIRAREKIREGEEVSFTLRQTALFPSLVLEMVSVGEKSGALGKMLEKVAATMENEIEADLRSLMSLLEPVMILIMGLGVGFIALSVLLPILEMSQIIR